MNDQQRLIELRHVLYNEIKGELSYNEKKEFASESFDEKVIARLLEQALRRKRRFSAFVVLYSIFLMVLLILFLIMVEGLAMILLVTAAIILLPVLTVNIFANKSFLGYQKLDLVLRLITRCYVRNKQAGL
ncbi:MAG: hypothetical protein EA408_11525 [Marinilabiliales bacterium]|nr:MAG: hypothetical protein EA408_11525 [Marinilabiliales bacterium]